MGTKLYWFLFLTVHHTKLKIKNHVSCVYFDLINAVLTRCTKKINTVVLHLTTQLIFTLNRHASANYGTRPKETEGNWREWEWKLYPSPSPFPPSTRTSLFSLAVGTCLSSPRKKVTSELRCITAAVWHPWCDICTSVCTCSVSVF